MLTEARNSLKRQARSLGVCGSPSWTRFELSQPAQLLRSDSCSRRLNSLRASEQSPRRYAVYWLAYVRNLIGRPVGGDCSWRLRCRPCTRPLTARSVSGSSFPIRPQAGGAFLTAHSRPPVQPPASLSTSAPPSREAERQSPSSPHSSPVVRRGRPGAPMPAFS